MYSLLVPGHLTDNDVFHAIAQYSGVRVVDRSFPMVHFFCSTKIYSSVRFFQVYKHRNTEFSSFSFSVKFFLPENRKKVYVFDFRYKLSYLYILSCKVYDL